ncbi:MAG: hypothetical protein EPO02_00565 [Nitrospirae bacterium]|nr:MAG: hypothetical protein EPO02_00565 [Nitrospirota bacterium]
MGQPVTIDPWKTTAIGLLVVVAAVGITTMVVGQKSEAPSSKSSAIEHHRTTQAEIHKCNEYAAAQTGDKTTTVLKDAGIGAVAGAGTGAAGGAIADGGSGAGKGAAIGGIVGVVGGTLYGLNENRGHDERYQKAYASCMRSHGYE